MITMASMVLWKCLEHTFFPRLTRGWMLRGKTVWQRDPSVLMERAQDWLKMQHLKGNPWCTTIEREI